MRQLKLIAWCTGIPPLRLLKKLHSSSLTTLSQLCHHHIDCKLARLKRGRWEVVRNQLKPNEEISTSFQKYLMNQPQVWLCQRSTCHSVSPLHTADMVSWWLHTGKIHDEARHNCVGVSVFCVLNGVGGDSKFTGTNSNRFRVVEQVTLILPNPVICTLNFTCPLHDVVKGKLKAHKCKRCSLAKTGVFRVVEWTGISVEMKTKGTPRTACPSVMQFGILRNDVNLAGL